MSQEATIVTDEDGDEAYGATQVSKGGSLGGGVAVLGKVITSTFSRSDKDDS